MEIENIENKVRNKLTPFQTAQEILSIIRSFDADSKETYDIMKYLQSVDLPAIMQENIDWLIKMAHILDKYIDNEYFDIVELMNSYKEK